MKRLVLVLMFVCTLSLASSRASADTVTFNFTGNCLDCSDPQGTLVLQNYTFGDPVTLSNLVSFTYTSSLADVSVAPDNVWTIVGSLGSTSGSYDFGIGFMQPSGLYTFGAQTDGTWCFGVSGTCAYSDFCIAYACGGGPIGLDHGDAGTFSLTDPTDASVPEPSNLMLFGSGLVGIAAMVRRRIGVAAVARHRLRA